MQDHDQQHVKAMSDSPIVVDTGSRAVSAVTRQAAGFGRWTMFNTWVSALWIGTTAG
jgi:hypothetical protein